MDRRHEALADEIIKSPSQLPALELCKHCGLFFKNSVSSDMVGTLWTVSRISSEQDGDSRAPTANMQVGLVNGDGAKDNNISNQVNSKEIAMQHTVRGLLR